MKTINLSSESRMSRLPVYKWENHPLNDAVEDKRLRVLIINWNLHGKMCSPEQLRRVLRIEQIKHHIYAIGTEECWRSIQKSLFIQKKIKFENNLK